VAENPTAHARVTTRGDDFLEVFQKKEIAKQYIGRQKIPH
jgi:hypothetical protein